MHVGGIVLDFLILCVRTKIRCILIAISEVV